MRVFLIFFAICFFLTTPLVSQSVSPSVISADGGISRISGYQIEWTMGEPAVGNFVGIERSFTEGFHQPILEVQRIDPGVSPPINPKFYSGLDPDNAILIFPNPTKSSLNIKLNLDWPGDVQLLVNQPNGGLLINELISSVTREVDLDLSGLSPGLYYLLFNTREGERITTCKISKIQ